MHLLEIHMFELNVTSLSIILWIEAVDERRRSAQRESYRINSTRNIFINLHEISFDSSRKFRTINCRLQTSFL